MTIALQSQLLQILNKPALNSKKFIMAVSGLLGIGLIYISSFIFMLIRPDQASNIGGVATTAIATWGTLAGICVGVQGWQDANATSALTNNT